MQFNIGDKVSINLEGVTTLNNYLNDKTIDGLVVGIVSEKDDKIYTINIHGNRYFFEGKRLKLI